MISVIVPCYGVEPYLPECIESIIGQTYKDLEIILIDDGSPDRSGDICEHYAKLDSRIKVIHQKNGGAARARNAGLSIAEGEYLAFVDGDDYLDKNAYEKMMSIMRKYNADVVQCAFRDIFVNKEIDRIRIYDETVFSTEEYLKRFLSDWTCGLLWDKLFERSIFDGIFFEVDHKIDDEFFTYQGIMNASKIVGFPYVAYNYRKRKSSVMSDLHTKEIQMFDRLDYATQRRKKIIERYPELKQEFDHAYLESILMWSRYPAATVPVINEMKRLISCYFTDNKPCTMSFAFRLQLLKLRYCCPKLLVSSHKTPDAPISQNQYFE